MLGMRKTYLFVLAGAFNEVIEDGTTGCRFDAISVNLVTNWLIHSVVYRSHWRMLVMGYGALTFLRFSECLLPFMSEKRLWTVGSRLPDAMYYITRSGLYRKDVSNVLLL